MNKRFSKAVALLALSVLSTLALAEAPGRVGRIALSEGKVGISAQAGEEVNAARVNWPVTSDNQITTDPGARTEIRIGSTAIRLDGDSALDVVELDDDTLRLHLHYGSASVRVRDLEAAKGFELSTPQGRVRLQEPGRVRIDAERVQDTSTVSVFDGVALVDGGGSTLTIRANRRAELHGDDIVTGMAQRDAFDDWAAVRDRRDDSAIAQRYVGSEMTGYEDLDQYGTWRDDAEYGPLWIPRSVSADWAPYRDGRWAWVQPWGWTWVDNAPWGYAPFHYGRWVVVGKRWCWAPGRHIGRPVWSPALVGWVGGSGWSVNFRSGHGYRPAPAQGWYPLAPRDTFVPHYHVRPDHLRYLNRHARDDDHRRDRRDWNGHQRRHGLTVVPHDHFGRRQEVVVPAIARAQVTPQLIQTAPNATPPGPVPVRRELTMPYVERHDGVRVNPRYAAPGGPRGGRDGRDGRDGQFRRSLAEDAGRGAAPVAQAPQVIQTDPQPQQPQLPQVIRTYPPQPGPTVGYDGQRDFQRRRDEDRARRQAERDARDAARGGAGTSQVQPQPLPQAEAQPQPSSRWMATARAAAQAQREERRFTPPDHEQRQAPVYSAQRSTPLAAPQPVMQQPAPTLAPRPMPAPMPQPAPVQPMPQPVMAAPQPSPAPAPQPGPSSRGDGPRERAGRHQMLR